MSSTASSFQALGRLLRYARGYRRRIIAATLCSILNKLFDIAPEILIGVAIDVVVNQFERFLDGGANAMIQVGVTVVAVGAVFFVLSPLIALLAFTPIPLIIWGAFYFQRKAGPLYAEVRFEDVSFRYGEGGATQGSADPGARRGDQRGGQRDRGGDPALAASHRPRAHGDHDRPPPLDHRACR